MITCPYCQRSDRQVKAGMHNGVQRYKCAYCARRYVPVPKHRGYPDDIRLKAIALHADGMAIRQIGRELDLNPRTIVNWIRNASLPATTNSDDVETPGERLADTQPQISQKRRTTIVDVAESAGVSVSTVSNFLNKKGRMSDETRTRIEASMLRLRFTPNSLVRAIRRRKTGILGVVTYGLFELDTQGAHRVTPPLLSGINIAADAHGYNVLLYTGWPHRKSSITGLDFLDGHIDGLIWVGAEMDTPEIKVISEAGLPVVALLTRIVPDRVGFVTADNVNGVRRLVTHLASLGHQRIAYAGQVNASDFIDRFEGYKLGLNDSGIRYDAELAAADDAISTNWLDRPYDYEKALDRWLRLEDRPTAIMLATDAWAAWVINRLQANGIRVPGDIAVTGFDDTEQAKTIAGGITTVRQSFPDIGKIGVERLVAMINGEPAESARVVLPTELVIRSSTISY